MDLVNYIDYERFGRDVAMDERQITDEGYIRNTETAGIASLTDP